MIAGPALALLLLLAGPVGAQAPFDACRDRYDRLIHGVVDNDVAYAALATVRDGREIIVWNAAANRFLSRTEQIFIYLHECAHHRLGHLHVRGDNRRLEIEADCWAIQLLVDGKMIKGRHLAELERARRTVPGDRSHLGGEAHVLSLRRCLEARTDPSAWAAALDTMVASTREDFLSSRGRPIDSLAEPPLSESLHGPPGTFDCEVAGVELRCLVFASREPEPAAERYRALMGLLARWLPPGWTAAERQEPARRVWLARDDVHGTRMALALAGTRVHFLMKRAPA